LALSVIRPAQGPAPAALGLAPALGLPELDALTGAADPL
jgi:hypothetical protein